MRTSPDKSCGKIRYVGGRHDRRYAPWPLLFDDNLNPKPAYFALADVLMAKSGAIAKEGHDMTDSITDFRGDYAFLSNFYAASVEMDGANYPTIEHAFQAAKTPDYAKRRAVRNAETPSAAKRMGRRIKRREDWFDVSLDIMESLVRQKFTRYPDLSEQLLATSDAALIEGNNWNDRFYGAVWDSTKDEWVGENHLGRILMKVRTELREAI